MRKLRRAWHAMTTYLSIARRRQLEHDRRQNYTEQCKRDAELEEYLNRAIMRIRGRNVSNHE